jgi:hypothetical protein
MTLSDHGVNNPSYTAAIDGTTVVALLEYSKAYGCIIGRVYPNHMVIWEDIADLKSKLNACSIETANEVKYIMISFQELPKGLPQFWLINNGRPQGKNKMSSYTMFVVCDVLDDPSTTEKYPAVLLNTNLLHVAGVAFQLFCINDLAPFSSSSSSLPE